MRYNYLLSVDSYYPLSEDECLEITNYISDIVDANQITLEYLGSKYLQGDENND